MNTRIRGARVPLSAGIVVTLAIGMLAAAPMAQAAGPAPLDLGAAAPFAVLGASTVTSTGATQATGDLGVSPGPWLTGFPPGTLSGTIYVGDATAAQAQIAVTAAYLVAAALPVTDTHTTLGGLTLAPGVYAAASSMNLTGNLTLDGQNDPTSVWVFQVPTTLTTASTSTVQLINGASSCNVFWQVGSSATLGTGSSFLGTILAQASITITTSAVVHGRALARTGAVTLDGNTITTTCLTSPLEAATPSPTPTPTPTPAPTATPTPVESVGGVTATPTSAVGGAIGTPRAATPPPTGTASSGPGNNSALPPFALPICLALGLLGLGALVAQRRSIRPKPTRHPLR